MSIFSFLLARLLRMTLVITLATVMGFVLVAALPGDRLTSAAPFEGRQPVARPAVALPIRAQLGQYVGAVLRGDLGTSTSEARPVRTMLGEALPATMQLAGVALLLAAFVGVGLGSWSGWHAHDRRARALNGALLAMYTLPDVVLATIGLGLFAAGWGLLPAGGLSDPRIALTGTAAEQLLDRLRHLVLPASVLALSWSAALFRQQRQAVAALANAPAMDVARAKGVPTSRLLWRHAVPQASLGTVALVGALLPTLVGGAVVIETVFAWPGMGRLLVHAVAVRDAPLLAGGLVCVACAVAVGSVATDTVARWLDPRAERVA